MKEKKVVLLLISHDILVEEKLGKKMYISVIFLFCEALAIKYRLKVLDINNATDDATGINIDNKFITKDMKRESINYFYFFI